MDAECAGADSSALRWPRSADQPPSAPILPLIAFGWLVAAPLLRVVAGSHHNPVEIGIPSVLGVGPRRDTQLPVVKRRAFHPLRPHLDWRRSVQAGTSAGHDGDARGAGDCRRARVGQHDKHESSERQFRLREASPALDRNTGERPCLTDDVD